MPNPRHVFDEKPQDLPQYTYVPGLTPHPISDPQGHWAKSHPMFNDAASAFAYATQLFNAGYYWEAHEVWEGVWITLGRRGDEADVVKGLIKLAACGVKCLEQNAEGARRHARRASELLSSSEPLTLTLSQCDGMTQSIPPELLMSARKLAESLRDDPRLADAGARDAARQGGVPLLGSLVLRGS